MLVRFELSCGTFGGYAVTLNPFDFHSTQEIADFCAGSLISTLTDANFEILLQTATKLRFHIHDLTLEDIRSHPGQTYYVCSHCAQTAS